MYDNDDLLVLSVTLCERKKEKKNSIVWWHKPFTLLLRYTQTQTHKHTDTHTHRHTHTDIHLTEAALLWRQRSLHTNLSNPSWRIVVQGTDSCLLHLFLTYNTEKLRQPLTNYHLLDGYRSVQRFNCRNLEIEGHFIHENHFQEQLKATAEDSYKPSCLGPGGRN